MPVRQSVEKRPGNNPARQFSTQTQAEGKLVFGVCDGCAAGASIRVKGRRRGPQMGQDLPDPPLNLDPRRFWERKC